MKKFQKILIALSLGLIVWSIPEAEGIHEKGWTLFAIFISTMIAIILKPFPMGTISIISLTFAIATNTLTFAEAFSGFSNDVVWLVVIAFFVARGFISTGLGNRLAYLVMSVLGKNTLGLGYGLVATDLILAPTIPSVTARVGGVVYPMVKALADVFTGPSNDPRIGGFLSMTAFQGSLITSAMFLTAMAGNPLIVELARTQGVEITWGSWMIAALLPGIVSLITIPYVIYKFCSPTIRKTPHAKEMADRKLAEIGSIKRDEWIMLFTFILLIVLWITGASTGIKAVVAAMIGVSILLVTGIISWQNITEETGAWDTFIWFATLVTLSGFLNKFGITAALSNWVVQHVAGFHWIGAFLIVSLIYFYSHYFFASSVAHIGAMYAPLLVVAIALGAPAELAALTLAFFSSLFGGLTHYSSGPAPILFGTGFVSISTWWKVGLIVSIVNIGIWLFLGGLWWKILGLW